MSDTFIYEKYNRKTKQQCLREGSLIASPPQTGSSSSKWWNAAMLWHSTVWQDFLLYCKSRQWRMSGGNRRERHLRQSSKFKAHLDRSKYCFRLARPIGAAFWRNDFKHLDASPSRAVLFPHVGMKMKLYIFCFHRTFCLHYKWVSLHTVNLGFATWSSNSSANGSFSNILIFLQIKHERPEVRNHTCWSPCERLLRWASAYEKELEEMEERWEQRETQIKSEPWLNSLYPIRPGRGN